MQLWKKLWKKFRKGESLPGMREGFPEKPPEVITAGCGLGSLLPSKEPGEGCSLQREEQQQMYRDSEPGSSRKSGESGSMTLKEGKLTR